MSRALSALRPVLDTSTVEKLQNVGQNPEHSRYLTLVKSMTNRKYKLSKILKHITRNKNMGVNLAKNLFPKDRKKKNKTRVSSIISVNDANGDNLKPPQVAWTE